MTGVAAEEITLIHGMTVLAGDMTLEALGLDEESTINMVLSLCGGKKKRKKKIYTKPKKIGHKHKKRPKAILEYFNVDNTGKIVKLKIECEKCPPGKSLVLRYACLLVVEDIILVPDALQLIIILPRFHIY